MQDIFAVPELNMQKIIIKWMELILHTQLEVDVLLVPFVRQNLPLLHHVVQESIAKDKVLAANLEIVKRVLNA